MRKNIRGEFAISLLGGVALAGSWLTPSSAVCALLGWISVLLLSLQATQPFRTYTQACVAFSIAFAWLTYTITYFGGFPVLGTFFTFLLFVFGSALQLVIFSLLARSLKAVLPSSGLWLPISWITGEVLMFRIFPWSPGHSQFAFWPLSLSAALGGVPVITFAMFWLCGSLISRRASAIGGSTIFTAFLIAYGTMYNSQIEAAIERAPTISVAVIQANTSIEERSQRKFFANNRARFELLSQQIESPPDLIVWPEGVIQDWIPDEIRHVRYDSRVPYLGPSTNFLVGAMTYTRDRHYYNSAIGVRADGTILPPYHKQILMPFGEYLPFSSLLSQFGHLAEMIGGLSAGNAVTTMELPLAGRSYSLTVSPLICYEDILPRLAGAAVRAGAKVMVNLTNDTWFGKSVAPLQHQLIASFRAVENGRVLVRSTNSGLTSVVLPNASTPHTLPVFSEGILRAEVPLLNTSTPFTQLHLEYLPHGLAALGVLLFLVSLVRSRLGKEKNKPDAI